VNESNDDVAAAPPPVYPAGPEGTIYNINQGIQRCDVFWLLPESNGDQRPKKRDPPTYPTTSNVFANDDHHTSSPMLNRPLTLSVLNPTATFSDDINQNSIVLKMTYGSVSFLFMGDADAEKSYGQKWNKSSG
jgi:hypothetical protein